MRNIPIVAAVTAILLLTGCQHSGKSNEPAESGPALSPLAPSNWSAEEQSKYWALQNGATGASRDGEGSRGIVVGTSGAVAVHAGVKALQQGGSAADAAITTVLAQAALHVGGATSFAGNMQLYYFEAATGRVQMLDATYASILEEEDPLSIPAYTTPSGRAVLVPGFMAGIGALHERFGTLPLAKLFEPAIEIATKGIVVSPGLSGLIKHREHVITRLPEGRKIFVKSDGTLYASGDILRQPQLAETLRSVAREGTSYLYTGDWGRQLVAAVQAQGGRMSMADLERYRAGWSDSRSTLFRDYEVFASVDILEALNVVEAADLRNTGDYHQSPDALYELIRISRLGEMLGYPLASAPTPAALIEQYLPGFDRSFMARIDKSHARQIWAAMQSPGWAEFATLGYQTRMSGTEGIRNLLQDFRRPAPKRGHTAGVVAVDEAGNMVALTHSVTSAVWGELGIFIGGISVVDSGAVSQHLLAAVGPGEHWTRRWDGEGCPAIAVKEGKAVFGCSSVGFAYYEYGLQGIVNVLEYGLDPQQSASQPFFRRNWPPGIPLRQPIGDGQLSRSLLEAVRDRGIDLEVVDNPSQASFGGLWIGVTVDPETGLLRGASTSSRSGLAEGY